MAKPYRTTPVFDADSLPPPLRREHSTKSGVWGIIRVLEGRLLLVTGEGCEVLSCDRPGLIHPQQEHRVEPIGAMLMQVEFYDCPPHS